MKGEKRREVGKRGEKRGRKGEGNGGRKGEKRKGREGGSERLKKLYLLVYCFNNRNVSNREKSLKVA